MLHGSAAELGIDHASKRKSRLGIILFFAYAIIYGIFVYMGLVHDDLLGVIVFRGLTLAVVYGIGLILLAGVMGLIYSMVCSTMEDKMNGRAKR